jgi:UDP-glucose:(heptosyl)LPS alpha-1,3-glucosyltransferase
MGHGSQGCPAGYTGRTPAGIMPTRRSAIRNPRSAFPILVLSCARKTAGLKTPGFIPEFMKIGLVRRGFSRAGGAESYLKRLGRGLVDAGHQLTLFSTEDWPPAEWPYGTLVRLKESTPLAFSQAVQAARKNVEILFSLERIEACDCYRAGDGVHRVWLEKRKTFEPGWKKSFRFSNGKHNQILELEQKLLGQQGTRRVITNSKLIKNEIVAEFSYPEDRISVIYNGIADVHFKKKPGSRWDLRFDAGLTDLDIGILFAGSGWERKGLRFAIEAIRSLKDRRIKFLIAGEGKKPAFTPPNTRFLGPVEDMHSLYVAADLFVLPTVYDPFSNACLEALSSGVPVITTSSNGFSEIIQSGVHGEILDRPEDVQALANAITHWCAMSQKDEVRAGCIARAQEYTAARNVTETMRVLEQTHSEKKSNQRSVIGNQ